ncbi:hypothetical protein ACLK1S_18925 [Escherichia coli]
MVTEESISQQLSHLAEMLIVAACDWLYDACLASGEARAMRRAKRNRC